ncbi:C40 family peptidase [Pontibacter litorisediminis]|uniref:C40 family peptidase n=1 Tax=Pontibacter litorisediminis TaxID=1846260 RepID=UPI0023EDDD6A|nr:C40 family peptidase [Pontibacter litorisediminis]
MKKNLLLILSPVLLLVLLLVFMPQHFARSRENKSEFPPALATSAPQQQDRTSAPEQTHTGLSAVRAAGATESQDMISYALTLIGTPYVWAGETPEGFDCSGFITHVYEEYGVQLPHSSRMQADEGEQVTRQEAQPGDLVIFTGTNPQVREPGHVGIVISQPGDTIEFVHSSSNGGVKISQVEGSGYEGRFLQVRRVL